MPAEKNSEATSSRSQREQEQPSDLNETGMFCLLLNLLSEKMVMLMISLSLLG